jgi:hypothetical protein
MGKKCPWMADYYNTLEASTQIIIFLEMLKFSKMIFLENIFFFGEGQQRFFLIILKWNVQIN